MEVRMWQEWGTTYGHCSKVGGPRDSSCVASAEAHRGALPAAPFPWPTDVTSIDGVNNARDVLAQLRRPPRTDAQIGDGEPCHRSHVAQD